jgi:5-methylcytosine-specific restriction endonuclease McrA
MQRPTSLEGYIEGSYCESKVSSYYKSKPCEECGIVEIKGNSVRFCVSCSLVRVNELKKSNYKRKNTMEQKCTFCGAADKLHVHHIDKDGKNNSDKNLTVLCSSCHYKLHHKFYNPLLRRVFRMLSDDRHSLISIAVMFNTTKQNVARMLKQDISTEYMLTEVNSKDTL